MLKYLVMIIRLKMGYTICNGAVICYFGHQLLRLGRDTDLVQLGMSKAQAEVDVDDFEG